MPDRTPKPWWSAALDTIPSRSAAFRPSSCFRTA